VADLLDQSEVDALLTAMNNAPANQNDRTARGLRGKPQKPVSNYDFKRPERVSKDQMRSLEAIHEGFSRNLGASLSAYLRTIVEIRVATIEQLTYSEFIHSLPNPTNFNLLVAEPLQGQMCLEISPLIIYPIIDRLLGGSDRELFIPQRPLTNIELRLVRRITDRAMACLTEVWSNFTEVNFELQEVESNPHLVQIVAPNEVVVVIGFEAKMGQLAGTISFCIPFNVIEPVMPKISGQNWGAYKMRLDSLDSQEQVAGVVSNAKVEVRGILANTWISMKDLVDLQPGDIIQTEKNVNREIVLQVEGKNKFAGALGKCKDKLALKITREIQHEDRV
jgi:flagellar motor switch protein FliM